ncbi:Uncharacterised protein (plasmid) [Mycoplasmopsis maculosa]|uniref:Uncharacterized protein n=1 Tax=Mycoplasmopsis maculosa TaxID=114885 RepID=A0A449B5H6_9BACT|nr:hypothetical protein [Mycoplasmopsis maculosa]VEU75292.1 Uncharacterised protein [Mycoplasmopsis maculosa]VEU75832.1 Uncharacterised protein [Mycoplasmopsis maculosa]
MLYKMWNKEKFCTNFFIFYKKYKHKPTHFDAQKLNSLFHKNIIEKNKKLQSMKLSSLIDAITNNKVYVSSTGTKTKFLNIDIDYNGNEIFKTLLKYYNFVFEKTDLNNKNNLEMSFLKYFTPTFFYETNSSSFTLKKMRLVYALDESIEKELAVKIVEKMILIIKNIFNAEVDKASKNLKQLFYGTVNKVFSNKNVRIYNAKKLLEILDYFINLYELEENKKTKSIFSYKYNLTDFIEVDNYEDALWIYIALFKINMGHLLIAKQKWLDKFKDTMTRRPYFKVKRNSKGYEILKNSKLI